MAEQLVQNQTGENPNVAIDDVQRAIHEIQVYQAELELQNQELRSVQTELENSRNKYYELFDLAPIGYFLVDRQYRVVEVNMAGLAQLEYPRAEIKNKPFLNFVSTKDHQRAIAFLDSIESEHRPHHFFADIRSRNNVIRNTRIDALLTDSRIEHTRKILLTVTDLSELNKTQVALQESESLYRSLVHSSADHIFMLSSDGYFLASNDRVAHFGLSAGKQLAGHNITDVYSSAESPHFIEQLNLVITTQKPVTFEHRVHINGRAHHHVNRLYPIYKKKVLSYIGGISQDITQLKQAQIEKEKLQVQLRQAQKMESIGTLAGGIAHDFNNILASILGFTELALEDVEMGTQLEDSLQEVHMAGKRAQELVNSILTFARQTDERVAPIRVDKIIKEVIKLLRYSMPATIDIEHDIPSTSLIMGNATQIHQIVMNLCTNGAQAMDEDGGRLKLVLRDAHLETDDEVTQLGLPTGDYLILEVSDTGKGIPPDIIDSIFEPYFTTKSLGDGTGMGLSLVHGIVESHGGKVTVKSRLGEGAVFTVYLPITRTTSKDQILALEKLPKGSEHILLLDDDAAVAKMGSRLLESLGYCVTTQTSSLKALEVFRSGAASFDLVLTDMTMPQMTGDKLALELKNIRRDIPIILCSGYSKKIDDIDMSEIGIDTLITKPFRVSQLAQDIRKVLDEAKTKYPSETSTHRS